MNETVLDLVLQRQATSHRFNFLVAVMHTSYVCPQRRVNFAECEEGLGMKLQPLSDKSNEDNAEVDVYPIQEELLVVAKVITTRAMVEEGEDWRQGCIFRTCVVHCNTVYDAIIDSALFQRRQT